LAQIFREDSAYVTAIDVAEQHYVLVDIFEGTAQRFLLPPNKKIKATFRVIRNHRNKLLAVLVDSPILSAGRLSKLFNIP
jgi:hypothetical protein